MTPTEQDKELRAKLANTKTFNYDVYFGQDIASSCIPFEEALDEIMQLITADRKRVALEARIDERSIYISDHINGKNSAFIARVKNAVEHEHLFDRNSLSCKCGVSKIFMVDAADEIAELKAQQEEV